MLLHGAVEERERERRQHSAAQLLKQAHKVGLSLTKDLVEHHRLRHDAPEGLCLEEEVQIAAHGRELEEIAREDDLYAAEGPIVLPLHNSSWCDVAAREPDWRATAAAPTDWSTARAKEARAAPPSGP